MNSMSTSPPVTGSSLRRKPRILCVDDEEQVLNGLDMLLGRRYAVLTASSGARGLELLTEHADVEVIISDMRMPGMDGAAFLRAARDIAPDATRLLLTGQAELSSAIAAINEGQIFRFLTKPCPPSELNVAIEAAMRQHRLVVGERELLEGTLQGSLAAMIEVLSLSHPLAFGRATRVQSEAMQLAKRLDMGQPWELNVAAILMELGSITLPEAVLEKLHHGQALEAVEQSQWERAQAGTQAVLAKIPRLESVRAVITLALTDAWPRDVLPEPERREDIQRMGRALRAARQFDVLTAQGMTPKLAVETLASRAMLPAVVIEALTEMHCADGVRGTLRELPPHALRVGMVLADDLRMSTGAMLVPRGFTVSDSLLARLGHLSEGALRGHVRVYVDAASA